MEKSVKSTAVTYGIYLGIALSILTIVAYAFNLALFTEWWFGIFSFVLLIVIGILAVKSAKKLKTTYFSFKSAFTTYFVTILIGTLISTVISILLFNFIDPEAAETVKELSIEAARGMMEKFNAPESDINTALAEMEKDNQFSLINQLKRYVFSLAFLSLIGLIIALIFREKDPNKQ
ncbi:DUF4199 domain-containing protein [Gillisia sp. M10.2A]|uniref:DUF4199 domain-containing protein n=1 Tax=Gillisia lutea TaxID=2909668 RepID=A0ABS9EFY5_9FLAO|nr:DUF4199 domain-containing protein [Gillisia lutea]MCF4101795.1 DUF4199 domain-containing protein [Gillisia lutea]